MQEKHFGWLYMQEN